MRKLLFASHAYLAKGILSSLELIMGHQEQVDILCAYTEEPYDLRTEIQRRLDALGEQDELIVVTDVFGGSVNNEFMSVIADCGQKVHLVAGLNLSLLMNLCSRMDEDGDTAEIIKACLEEARCSMQYCNELLTADQAVKDEEF